MDVFKTKGTQVVGANATGPASAVVPLGQAIAKAASAGEVIARLKAAGNAGEQGGFEYGYANDAAGLLSSSTPEVVAAAIEALGNMIGAGEPFADEIAAKLVDPEEQVQTAAATALGMFGTTSLAYTKNLCDLIENGRAPEAPKVAAICTLGYIGAEAQGSFIASYLENGSPLMAAAACQALGYMGSEGELQAEGIVKRLKTPETKFAAISALAELGPGACEKYIGDIIGVLTDKDSLTRQHAGSALAACADAVLESKDVGAVKELMNHKEPGVRCSAAMVFGYMGAKAIPHADAVATLLADTAEDTSETYLQMGGGYARSAPAARKPQCAALIALGMMGASSEAPSCGALLSEESWEVKLCALECLAGMGDAGKDQAGKIAGVLDDNVFLVRQKACETIGLLKATESVMNLSDVLQDKVPSVRAAALTAMAECGGAEQYPNEVFKCFTDQMPNVKAAAITCIGSMGESGTGYASAVATALSDDDDITRAAAAEAMGKLGKHGASFAEEVAVLLGDPSPDVRSGAATGLGLMGREGQPYMGHIEMLMDDPFEGVSAAAVTAMENLTNGPAAIGDQ